MKHTTWNSSRCFMLHASCFMKNARTSPTIHRYRRQDSWAIHTQAIRIYCRWWHIGEHILCAFQDFYRHNIRNSNHRTFPGFSVLPDKWASVHLFFIRLSELFFETTHLYLEKTSGIVWYLYPTKNHRKTTLVFRKDNGIRSVKPQKSWLELEYIWQKRCFTKNRNRRTGRKIQYATRNESLNHKIHSMKHITKNSRS